MTAGTAEPARALCPPALALTLLACHSSGPAPPPPRPELDCSAPADWPQFSRAPGHDATTCAAGQPLGAILFAAVVDESAEAEKAEAGGELLAHYQTPLVAGDEVVVEHKSGPYVSCLSGGPAPCGPDAWASQTWGERGLRWSGGALSEVWSFDSDWKPPPNGPTLEGWEPVFHAALMGPGGSLVAVPGAGGALHLLDRSTGELVRTVDPFGGDPDTYVAGAVAADDGGSAWYTALRLDPVDPWGDSGRDAAGFLCQVRPDGSFLTASFADLVPGAPAPADLCGAVRCGAQRPQLNAAPAIAGDGTVFVVSRAHQDSRAGFVVAVGPDLAPRWAHGFATGALAGAEVVDQSTSSPVALPDGGVLYGAFTADNGGRGHLFHLGADAAVLATYDFGWDVTPAVFPHDGTWSAVVKDNHYPSGPFLVTQLDARLRPEWSLASGETRSCQRNPDGSVSCADDGQHPGGFEWCVNAVAVDRDGVVYASSEDGYLYAIAPGGRVRDRLFLQLALGAAYTPVSLDAQGRIYAQNDGALFVVGAP